MKDNKWKRKAVKAINAAWGSDWGDDGLVEAVAVALETSFLMGWSGGLITAREGLRLELSAREKLLDVETLLAKLMREDGAPFPVLSAFHEVLKPQERDKT